MARKPRTSKTTPTKTVEPAEKKVAELPKDTEKTVETKPAPKKEKVIDFEKVREVLKTAKLKSGETADDNLSIIAIKFYQRINKLKITGKLDTETLDKMGL